VITCNTLSAYKLAPRRPAGVEVMIASMADPHARTHVMKGYYNPGPRAKPSTSALVLRDIGELIDGFHRITDRKKDIIVTAGGKNIAPQPIEGKLKTNKYVSQAVMIGDKRKFPSVLIVPNWDQLEKWAGAQGIVWTSRAELLAMPTIHAKMEKEVAASLPARALRDAQEGRVARARFQHRARGTAAKVERQASGHRQDVQDDDRFAVRGRRE
jgi:long-chain acyl-CoA synthetase